MPRCFLAKKTCAVFRHREEELANIVGDKPSHLQLKPSPTFNPYSQHSKAFKPWSKEVRRLKPTYKQTCNDQWGKEAFSTPVGKLTIDTQATDKQTFNDNSLKTCKPSIQDEEVSKEEGKQRWLPSTNKDHHPDQQSTQRSDGALCIPQYSRKLEQDERQAHTNSTLSFDSPYGSVYTQTRQEDVGQSRDEQCFQTQSSRDDQCFQSPPSTPESLRSSNDSPGHSDEERIEDTIKLEAPDNSEDESERTGSLEGLCGSPTRAEKRTKEETPPVYGKRTREETQAAHDLLQLSRSLPPLAPTSLLATPHNTDRILSTPQILATPLSPPHVQHSPPSTQYKPPRIQHRLILQAPPTQRILAVPPVSPRRILAAPPSSPNQRILTATPGSPNQRILTATPDSPNQRIVVATPSSHKQRILTTASPANHRILAAPQAQILMDGPPTPRSQDDQPYATLIYIQPQPPSDYIHSDYHLPLTPPIPEGDPHLPPNGQDPHLSPLGQDLKKEDGRLPIADGRAKRAGENGERPKYSCSECGKDYATSSNLSRHKQTHRSLDSGSAKQCTICHKVYVSMPALSMHILTHNLNHRCDVCGKAFSRPWLLQGHKRSHTGIKPYSCTICVKSFADRSNLRAHMQTHSPAKNFKCNRCDKMFALKSYLNKHQESVCIRGNGLR